VPWKNFVKKISNYNFHGNKNFDNSRSFLFNSDKRWIIHELRPTYPTHSKRWRQWPMKPKNTTARSGKYEYIPEGS
jgi:hypothetical protein